MKPRNFWVTAIFMGALMAAVLAASWLLNLYPASFYASARGRTILLAGMAVITVLFGLIVGYVNAAVTRTFTFAKSERIRPALKDALSALGYRRMQEAEGGLIFRSWGLQPQVIVALGQGAAQVTGPRIIMTQLERRLRAGEELIS